MKLVCRDKAFMFSATPPESLAGSFIELLFSDAASREHRVNQALISILLRFSHSLKSFSTDSRSFPRTRFAKIGDPHFLDCFW